MTRTRRRAAAFAALALLVVARLSSAAGGDKYDFDSTDGVVRWRGTEGGVQIGPPVDVGPIRIDPRVPDVGHTDKYQGVDVVMEAPWRVLVRDGAGHRNVIPVLFFIPDARFPAIKSDGRDDLDDRSVEPSLRQRQLTPLRLRLRSVTVKRGDHVIYRDTDNAQPSVGDDFAVVDEHGKRVDAGSTPDARGLLRGGERVDRENEGWHRILRLPVAAVGWNGSRDPLVVTLDVTLAYQRVYRETTTREITHRKGLRVLITRAPLPALPPFTLALDVHHHTAAEYTTKAYPTAPRKAFGSPVQMIKEAAYSIGLVDTVPENLQPVTDHPLVTTDHNTFFADDDTIRVGPTSAAFGVSPRPYDAEPTHFGNAVGRAEFERLRAILGDAAGEEITLAGPLLGSHLLAYRTRHFDGAWHGGCLSLAEGGVGRGFVSVLKMLFWWVQRKDKCEGTALPDANPNSLDDVLSKMAAAERFPHGFAYASHPYNDLIGWREDMLAAFFKRDGVLRTAPQREFILKGLQIYNTRATYLIRGTINFEDDIDFYNLDPFGGDQPVWKRLENAGAWSELEKGFLDWQRLVRSGLAFSLQPDDPKKLLEEREWFIRKIYISGGSDTHGDFNYETAIPGTFIHDSTGSDWGWTVSNNAFGMVRTQVDVRPVGKRLRSTVDRALDALARGNSIVTDGPALAWSLDADRNFDASRHVWYDQPPASTLTEDGEVGGGPSAGAPHREVGAFDGGRTMLVRRRTPTDPAPDVAIRYRWANTPEFGGGVLPTLMLHRVSIDTPSPTALRDLEAARLPADGSGEAGISLGAHGVQLSSVGALTLALRTPDYADARVGPDHGRRALSNPIWFAPVDITCERKSAVPSRTIAKEDLTITVTFDLSMQAGDAEVRMDPIREGVSRPAAGQRLGTRGVQWRSRSVPGIGTVKNSAYVVKNDEAIDLTSDNRFVIYLMRPKDANGNELNAVSRVMKLPDDCPVR